MLPNNSLTDINFDLTIIPDQHELEEQLRTGRLGSTTRHQRSGRTEILSKSQEDKDDWAVTKSPQKIIIEDFSESEVEKLG